MCVDLDPCSLLISLLLFVCGDSISRLLGFTFLWLVGWGLCLYKHLSANLQLVRCGIVRCVVTFVFLSCFQCHVLLFL